VNALYNRGTDTPAQAGAVAGWPQALLACLPLLWSRVLFPGCPASRTPPRWRALLLLTVLPGALLYPCLSFLLCEPDEGRYAEIPREMLIRGEWIVPYLQGEPYLDKPPLLYWLVIGSYRVFGVHDWSARLVPASAIHVCVLVTYLLGRRSLGERAAFWGALALALAPGFITVGRLLVLDGLLTLWVTLSLLSAFEALRGERLRRGWWLAAAATCGLGVLTKGPVAVLLLVPPLVLHRRLTGRSCPLSGRAGLAFAGVVLGLSVPWYLAVCLRLPGFASYFFWRHNVLRFVAPFDHQEPVWYYGPIVVTSLLPASLLGISFVRFLLAGDPAAASRRCPELGFMLLAGGWCVLFFSLSGSKLPTYVLPAFPPLTLALGHFLANSRWAVSRWTRGTVVLTGLLLLALHYGGIPWFANFHSPMSRADEVARYCERTPVVCFPRGCDSVAFYLGRDDLCCYRSKEIAALLQYLQRQPRTVILFTHRHSPKVLQEPLQAAGLRLAQLTPISRSWVSLFKTEYCYMGVVERTESEGTRECAGD
jgi:4-amino-4-deoxy-L-arabinose transferase-like glycosyltransferase